MSCLQIFDLFKEKKFSVLEDKQKDNQGCLDCLFV